VTGAQPGVTLTLVSAQPTGAPSVGITVGLDTVAVAKNVQTFVSAFNNLMDAVDRATRYNPTTKKSSPLTGDNSVLNFTATTRKLVSSPAAGATGAYRTLADIGVSTGPIGSKPGTTSHLVLDQAKLASALQANPASVQTVVASIATSVDAHLGGALGSTGLFATHPASARAQQHAYDLQVKHLEDMLLAHRASYERRFARMEAALARLQGPRAYAAAL
jgi:flagellar hook-associated protein 2